MGTSGGFLSLLFGTFPALASLLVLAALLASFVPARRASVIDPMRALRQEWHLR